MRICLLLLLLAGCASTEEPKVCFMRMVGQTEDGWTVAAQHCITPEAFQASQK